MPPITGRKVSDNGKPQSASAGPGPISSYWATSDGETVRLYLGEVRDILSRLPARSVQCVVTSPPYWGLRDYGTAEWEGGSPECDHVAKKNTNGVTASPLFNPTGAALEGRPPILYAGSCPKCGARQTDQQIGSEPSPDCGTKGQAQCGGCFVCTMVAVFRGVRRVLRDDGTLWLNLGDSYNANTGAGFNGNAKRPEEARETVVRGGLREAGLKSGNLVGIPWRVALALQADGWVLRQDIIWCLSGGTHVYARTQKGDMPATLKDLYRLKSGSVRLWNGSRWTKVLGMSRVKRDSTELEILLRSGERIGATTTHRFPVKGRGIVAASDINVGDVLESCRLPEPDKPKRPAHVTNDAAWLAGLYVAEGSGVSSKDKFSLAGHTRETDRWDRVRKVVGEYGGTATLTTDGNNQTIRVYGKVVCGVVRELVTGRTAKDKGFAPVVWRYGDDFLEQLMAGYLSGDGAERCEGRWRLGFTRNGNLERDIRAACARLGWTLTLNQSTTLYNGERRKGYRGEICMTRSGHHNERDRAEVVAIRKSRCRYVYDVSVEDDPHLFALASGVLTHNSKPAPMPESVTNRCTKAHEYVFLLTKREGYYYDAEAIKESSVDPESINGHKPRGTTQFIESQGGVTGLAATRGFSAIEDGKTYPNRNKRSVWTISSHGYPGAHFATFPPKLVEPCILAGTSEKGACVGCGAPWGRVVEETKLRRDRPNDYVKRTGAEGTGNSCANSVAGVDVKTVGWAPGCRCGSEEVRPCIVLDPFIGSGTTCAVANDLGRWGWGIDLSEEYLRNHAIKRVEGALLRRPATSGLTGRIRKAVTGLGRGVELKGL